MGAKAEDFFSFNKIFLVALAQFSWRCSCTHLVNRVLVSSFETSCLYFLFVFLVHDSLSRLTYL
jgi:hypothetical protein